MKWNTLSQLLAGLTCFICAAIANAGGSLSFQNYSHGCLDQQAISNTTTTIYHGSSVEPALAVNPINANNIVAAWMQDRCSNGAALEIGFAYSADGGQLWRNTVIPFQICMGGISQRVGDPWLSYSADGSKLYFMACVVNATPIAGTTTQSGIVVTTSLNNGATWNAPYYLNKSSWYFREPTGLFPNLDKNAITADPNNTLNTIGVYAEFNPSSGYHSTAQSNITRNGGNTWTASTLVYDPFPDLNNTGLSNGIENDSSVNNNQVVILPKTNPSYPLSCTGDWLNFACRIYAKPGATDQQFMDDGFPRQYTSVDYVAVRSQDQGRTWNPTATIVVPAFNPYEVYTGGYTYDGAGNITGGVGGLMRNDQTIPSYNANPQNGFLYVTYQSGAFQASKLQQIGLTTSRDGGKTWSTPVQVSRTPAASPNPQAFQTCVAVTKSGRVGVLYFDFRNDNKLDPNQTLMDAWLAIYQEVADPHGGSTHAGLDFVKEIRLSQTSYVAQNGPNTTAGYMTDSDYQFLVAQGENFYALYTKAADGPFTPAVPFYVDPARKAILMMDNNYRTKPYFSLVKNVPGDAQLVFTNGNIIVAPDILSVTPPAGPLDGGTLITIAGRNFTGANVVVGGTNASNVVATSTQITAITPKRTAGVKDVVVNTVNGTTTATGAFTYVAAPTIASVNPYTGPIAGGTSITINGTYFTGTLSVMIGGASANSFVVNSDTRITAITPARTAGAKNISLDTVGGQATAMNAFTYGSAPTISTVAPSSGPIAGNTAITIKGTNFVTGATTVKVGGVAATRVVVVSPNVITANTPSGTMGARDVAVTANGATATATGAFTYLTAPTITSASPNLGPTLGRQSIVINGTSLTGTTRVTIGGAAVLDMRVLSSTSIQVTTPAGTAGAATIVVTTPLGTATKTNAFTFIAPPKITSLTPATGSTRGGTTITIGGTNFTTATRVTIDGINAASFSVASATRINAVTPAGSAGAKNVWVYTAGGIATAKNAFTYTSSFTGGVAGGANKNDGDKSSGRQSTSVLTSTIGAGKVTSALGANNSTVNEKMIVPPMGVELYLQTLSQCADAQVDCNSEAATTTQAAPTVGDGSNAVHTDSVVTASDDAIASPPSAVIAIDLDHNGVADICQLRAGDFDLNGMIDERDMSVLLNMMNTEPVLGIGDMDGNGVIDSADIGALMLQMN